MFTLAAQETPRGWGGPVAIVAAVAIFITFATLLDVWQRRQEARSPAEGGTPGVRVKAQVRSVSDTADTEPDTGWWGRIVVRGGRRVRMAEAPADDEIDLALDDQPETLEQAIARLDDEGVAYAEIVRRVMADYRVSASTAKRRIRDVRSDTQVDVA